MPDVTNSGLFIRSTDVLLAHPDEVALRSMAVRLHHGSGLDVWTTPLADEAIDVASLCVIGTAIVHRDIGLPFDWHLSDVLRRVREALARQSRGRAPHKEPVVHVPMPGLDECVVISRQRLMIV